ncbi:MAG: TRAP transporter large permease subunit [Pseudomonadota bacterium]|nr:TRAP transporter large permease subunit [Pseudomonadota bacterium]
MELFFLAVLILTMAFALGSGFPVAFALPGAAIVSIGLAAGCGWLFADNVDAYFHTGGPAQWLSAGVTNLRGVYWEVERDTLIAIPLFIFMGIMLQRSKIAEDLLVTMAQLFGPVPGGLGISVIFVGALLAATTGIVGATVVAMGLISLPAMLRNNYSPSLATGTIAASGTLGQIIPPSIVLIILADQLASAVDQASTARKALHKEATGELSMPSVFDVSSTSAGEMFLGAFVPGMVLVLLYMAFVLGFALIRPKAAPAVPFEGQKDRRFWGQVFLTLVPPLTLIFLVLGSIIGGIATVNQAGAIGAAGALIMGGYRLVERSRYTYVPALIAIAGLLIIALALASFEMNIKAADSPDDFLGIGLGIIGALLLLWALLWSGWRVLKIEDTLKSVMLETAKTTALVFIILLGAAMLTAAFRGFGGEDLVRDFLDSLPGGFWVQFIIVMAVIFVLGFFLDFIEIAVVVVPIVAPILLADPSANITAVWLGVMIGLNIQTSFLTPPFGFALFYLRGVAPATVKTVQMYKGVIAFISLQLLALLIVGLYPPLVNYLPNRSSFLSDTAPPPRNPRLQYCLEEYVGEQLARADDPTRKAVADARGLDLSALPKGLAGDMKRALDSADAGMAALEKAFSQEKLVQAAAVDYLPRLREVREIEKSVRQLELAVRELDVGISRARGDDAAEERAEMEARRAELQAEIAAVKARIPADWKAVYTEFSKVSKVEDQARLTWRRSSDQSYEQAAGVLAVLQATPAFLALEADIRGLADTIVTADFEAAANRVEEVERQLRAVEGAGDIASGLGKVRRALGPRSQNRDKALEEYAAALDAFEEQKGWRPAADSLVPGIAAYLDGIRGTLGARVQPKLNRDQSLFMAVCQSDHRDLSLHF